MRTFRFAALDRHVAAMQTGLLARCGSHETLNEKLQTSNCSRVWRIDYAPVLRLLLFFQIIIQLFVFEKRIPIFVFGQFRFFLCATQSEGTNHSVPTKKNRQIAGQDTKKNGSTLCNSTVLKRSVTCGQEVFLQQYLTGVRIKPMASLSSPLLTKNVFHPFFNKKREKGLLDVRFN